MSDDDEILLPPAGDRQWILDGLAELVRLRGPAHLLVAPLLVATPDYLPDRWVGGEASVRRLLRRLMIYADLPYDEVEVEVYSVGDERARVGRPSGKLAGVCDLWLVEARGRRARFAVEATLLGDPEAVAAAASRAIADAFRREHGIHSKDPADEQRRVDLTAVYLGFGRLTADAAHRYAKGGNRPVRQGLLSPKAACFALAAVAVARELDKRPIKTIAAGFQANQRAFFKRSVEALRGIEPSLAERLGLPPRPEWPEAPDLAELTAPLGAGDDDEDEVAEVAEERGIVGANTGKPVFRVERRAGLRIARTVVMACVMLGGLATRPQMGELLTMEQVVAGAVVLGIASLLLGSLLRESRCSEPKCGASLRPEMTECPRCGGTIRGSIRHPRERLAAEEALSAESEPPLGGSSEA
jgi:hypothetical protein